MLRGEEQKSISRRENWVTERGLGTIKKILDDSASAARERRPRVPSTRDAAASRFSSRPLAGDDLGQLCVCRVLCCSTGSEFSGRWGRGAAASSYWVVPQIMDGAVIPCLRSFDQSVRGGNLYVYCVVIRSVFKWN